MKIVILVLCYLLQSVIAQELYAARPNITILETLRTLSPVSKCTYSKELSELDHLI